MNLKLKVIHRVKWTTLSMVVVTVTQVVQLAILAREQLIFRLAVAVMIYLGLYILFLPEEKTFQHFRKLSE